VKSVLKYFTKFEIILWSTSIILIVVPFVLLKQNDYLTLLASIIGASFLILNAKGNPFGQVLTILFSMLYGVISYGFSYYGEMITYLCMSMPMAFIALVSWLKNPYKGKKSQVKVNSISKKEIMVLVFVTIVVSIVFYFILKYFNTANLIPSTFSVTTSFFAAYLTFRRSPYFALAYALNDVVLIILWILASLTDSSYISVVICFIVFLVNDSYSFINWKRMERNQKLNK
jgi:nicotinamide mononucleotide transporter PnuC